MSAVVAAAQEVSQRTWQTRQSLHAEVVVRSRRAWDDGALYRATVLRDSYDEQSRAMVHVWTDAGWVLLLSRTIHECGAIADRSYVSSPGEWEQDAIAACDALLDSAALMLGPQW